MPSVRTCLWLPVLLIGFGLSNAQGQEPDRDAMLQTALERLDRAERELAAQQKEILQLRQELNRSRTATDQTDSSDRLANLIDAYIARQQSRSDGNGAVPTPTDSVAIE